ncbi:hypothetical protein SAMN04487820_104218 [Actinopolyspora mzabensis]|uniref:Uncharacterized protein n=1 Tax=Actinopolyspora mzabensis TaxID=995066 RepID=A0A1G8Z3M6_ACTMZ|nr:hypothetical protein SAMN04487820_104218 [Actinopolyspora mzabensis]
MSYRPINLAAVIGSVRNGRFGPTVANWFFGRSRIREVCFPD